MSRIGGLIRHDPRDTTEVDLGPLTRPLLQRPDWGQGSCGEPGATLVWCGAGAPGVASRGPLHLVVDGELAYPGRGAAAGDARQALLDRLAAGASLAAALDGFDGDFALAVWDGRSRRLSLARDRFGVKPLYYVLGRSWVAFGSRPRALLGLPGVDPTPERRFVAVFAASHYRTFDNEPGRSPYAGIHQVPAAHVVECDGSGARSWPYWELQDRPPFTEPEPELAGRYRELLLDAVGRRLAGATRPVFTLSGGLDSSTVLSSAVRIRGRPMPAVSAVYDDATYDESETIRSMTRTCVETWHQVRVAEPDVFGLIRRMIAVHDEPVVTATWLSHFLVCERMAAEGFTHLFGGLGGDELNAGEYEHFFYFFADLRAAGDETRLAAEVAGWARHHDHPLWKKDMAVAEQALGRLIDRGPPPRCRVDRARVARYARALAPGWLDLQTYQPTMEHPFRSLLANRIFQDLTRETVPPCLRAEDRDAAAFGLVARDPLLDRGLMEFAFRVPVGFKYREGVTKRLLRQAMEGILPDETRLRIPKTGWNAPAHRWFAESGFEPLMDLVGSQRFRQRGIYDLAEVERLCREHRAIVTEGQPRENHMMFLWQLVNLELWLQDCVDR